MQNKIRMQSVSVSDVKELDIVNGYDIEDPTYRECLVSFEFDNLMWEGTLECTPKHLEESNSGEITNCEAYAPAHVEVAGMVVVMPR